jgi:hypothetical protein
MKQALRTAMYGFAALIGAASLLTTPAAAQSGVNVGTLTCNVASGWGFVFGSSRAINCTFSGAGGRYEYYSGQISKFGVDIGYTQGGVLVWTVVAPTAALGPGALSGSYAGGTASATVGFGLGANALIGGSNNTVALQPLSIEGNRGLNVAAGVAAMTLQYYRWRWPSPRSSCCCSIGWRSSAEADTATPTPQIIGGTMTLSIAHLQPIVALIAGVLILLMPRILNYVVAIYLIVTGLLGLNIIHF